MTLMRHALLLFSSFLIDAFTAVYIIPPCTACLTTPMSRRDLPEQIMSEFLYKLSPNLAMIHLHGQMKSSDELIPFSRFSSDGFTQPKITSCRIRLGYKHAINANTVIIISTLIKVFLNF